ncbi:MAG: 5-formyltetrahydrofolate cyclo-ligase [Rhizobacter sp.]|nr:5-formyltetrahydrofolate cyclo-ligase [Rhizobacter sp.]
MRRRLLAERAGFASGAEATIANQALADHLRPVLARLEPQTLGLYWAIRSEFNAVVACAADPACAGLPLALPFVRREPRDMHYRRWNGKAPGAVDEARIPTSDGEAIVPDVVLVPCVGFTADGYRLGYGGGYFDRWIAAHPHVTTIGIAWSAAALTPEQFQPAPHDMPLTLVLTERGVV